MMWRRLVFRVLKFQFSLVLYLSQLCLQHLSKIPDSWSSHSLHLCPSRHFGSSKDYFYISCNVTFILLRIFQTH
jgi:hypothetical protein